MAKLVAMTACLLAFDTSTESMAVALQSPGGTALWNGEGGAQASATLLPRIRRLLHAHALGMRAMDAIAFGAGPGAFTGLRTACSVAQGLALAVALPVLPIDSLLLVADDARAQHGNAAQLDVGVVMDARMGQLYAARYRYNPGGWVCTTAPMLCDPAVLVASWAGDGPAVVAGSGVHLLPTPLPTQAVFAQAANRAAALLRLAQQAYAGGAGVDAAQALPVYLRDKVAFTTLERAAQRDATHLTANAP